MKPRRTLNSPTTATKPQRSTGWILSRILLLFLVVAIPGFLATRYAEEHYSSSLPAPTDGTTLQRKVHQQLQQERDQKNRAVQESLERIRQSQ